MTDYGKTLAPVIEALLIWGTKHLQNGTDKLTSRLSKIDPCASKQPPIKPNFR